MNCENAYYKKFIILRPLDKSNSTLSGHVKIEANGELANINVTVENLKEDKNKSYKIILTMVNKNKMDSVTLGKLMVINSKGKLGIGVLKNNVCKSNLEIYKFNVITVIEEDNISKEIKFILSNLYSINEYRSDSNIDVLHKIKYSISAKDKDSRKGVSENKKHNNDEKTFCKEKNKDIKIERESKIKEKNKDIKIERELMIKEKYSDVQKFILLKEELNEHFELASPFTVTRSDYCWWNINNISKLNEILINYKRNFLINEKVIRLFNKYEHLIIGVYTDLQSRQEFLVFGVPCISGVDEKPIECMQRWVQLDNNSKEYGVFGYWLLYVE